MMLYSVMYECFFWYQLTRVVPDKIQRAVKWLCVCVCVCVGVVQSIVVNMSVCPLTYLENHMAELPKFLCMLPDGIAIHYVLQFCGWHYIFT